MKKLKITLVEPYFSGSHKEWAKGYKKNSAHDVELLTLPGRNWKWRMRAGAVTLAEKFIKDNPNPDLLLFSDMFDASLFLSLTRKETHDIPVCLYFHENQMTYPRSFGDKDLKGGRDIHFGLINITSALSADRVFFNSKFHMEVFMKAARELLGKMPEGGQLESIDVIEKKSAVLSVGMNFKELDKVEVEGGGEKKPPLILWNHRWEHDKRPDDFFKALYIMKDKGLDFELAILGESTGKTAKVFDEARARLASKIIHFGYAKDRTEYIRWLKLSDILPVTSDHDFFGCSVVEAIYCGAYPLLPNRLAYPEHIPAELQKENLYNSFNELVGKLEEKILNKTNDEKEALKNAVSHYDWSEQALIYDREIYNVFQSKTLK
ncbi:MAG: DUF3524 domain-containing protein [Deltaproteobacteria bacterium]|nr:DUF3524 domain-containing protein [Deltaproteobacteria bacterium]